MHCRMGEHGELTFGWCAQTSSASRTTPPAARRMRRCSTPKVLHAYVARFKGKNDSEEAYVERVRKELEDKFLELGPDTVVGCEFSRLPRLLSPPSSEPALCHVVVAETVVGATTGVVAAPKGYFNTMKSVSATSTARYSSSTRS